MQLLFDYIFYRAYKASIGKSDVPLTYASAIVSVSQFFVLFSLFAIVNYFFIVPELNIFWFGLIFVIIFAANWHRYERNPSIDKMTKRWGAEHQTKKLLKGWLIVFCIAFFIIAPFVIAKKNFESRHPIHQKVRHSPVPLPGCVFGVKKLARQSHSNFILSCS